MATVQRFGDGRAARSGVGREPEHEPAGVEDLHREAAADPHLVRVERGVRARPADRRPVAHRVAAVLVEQVQRCHDVADRLRHLLAVRIEDPARDRRRRPRQRAVEVAMRARIVANSQVRMISCACGRRSIGYTRAYRSSSSHQPPTICGDSEDVAHVSITSVSPMKPPGRPRSDSAYPGGVWLCGSIGSCSSVGQDRLRRSADRRRRRAGTRPGTARRRTAAG